MDFLTQNITASRATINASLGVGLYANIRITSIGSVTLAGNVSFASSVVSGTPASYTIRWEADLTLSTFSVAIEGFVINQSDVNQSGTFSCYYDGSAWSVQYFADGLDQPQVYYGVNSVTAATSGTTTWVAGVDKFYQRITGAPTTLVGSLVYTASTAGVKDGTQFFVEIGGAVTLGANTMTVFGRSISATDALNGNAMVIATFDATAGVWRSVYERGSFGTSNIEAIAALTVIANATNASAQPTAVAASSNGRVFMRRTNALGFNWLETDNFSGSTELFKPIKIVTVIPSANVLTSFTTPVVFIDGTMVPGGGYAIMLTLLFGMSSGGSAYATNTNIGIRYTGAADDLASLDGALAIAGTDYYVRQLILKSPTSGAVTFGNSIEFYTKTGNPTAGTRNVLLYSIITTVPAP